MHHPSEIEPRHVVRRVSGNEIRLVANLYKFLKPGELLANPKAHVVYEYYWPLATSKSFDPQPGGASRRALPDAECRGGLDGTRRNLLLCEFRSLSSVVQD
jgi:hypothetical protein